MPSAQPDILEDGTLMMTVPNGMLNDVKRVIVDEVNTKNCKVMYQDEPERKKGKWIREGSAFNLRCPYCRKFFVEPIGSKFNFCPNCGADMRGET